MRIGFGKIELGRQDSGWNRRPGQRRELGDRHRRGRLRHVDMPLLDTRWPGRVLIQEVGQAENDRLGGDNGRKLQGKQAEASHRKEIYDDSRTQTDGHSQHG